MVRGHDEDAVLESLYAAAPVGLGVWDADLRFRRVNPRLAEINGLQPDEHTGRRPSELLGAVGAEAEAAMRTVLDTGAPVVAMPFTGETPAAPGVTRHWQASFFAIAGGVGGVVVDVTEAETARANAEAVARATMALGSSMRPERVLDELVRATVPTLADVCIVHLARGDGVITPIAATAAPGREALADALAERQAADPAAAVGPAAVIRTGRPEVNAEITAEALIREGVHPEERRLLAELGVRSAAILPLFARGAVLGSLTLIMGPSGRSYGPELLELAESVAAGAGLALDNARLFAEQVEVARALQRTLLPSQLPRIPGAELAARYRAAGRSNQVGGDFYDVFEADDGSWGLVIGDVVGKGAEAAAITALVRATLQACVLRGDGPEAALRLVDEALRRRPVVQFCSAIHGRLRPLPGGAVEAELLAAGHPPPLVLRAAGALEEVDVSGTLLGVTEDSRFGAASVRLEAGDVLVLYTDGAIELRGRDPWRGEAALRETLQGSSGVPVGQLVERIEHEALVLSGGELRDDLALLAVQAMPPRGE